MNTFPPEVAPMGRYDTKRTCAELGISRSTLERHRKAGRITYRLNKLNQRPYYRGQDIIKLWRTAYA